MKQVYLKWGGLALAAVMLISITALISFKVAHKSFENEFFLSTSNKISFDDEKVDAAYIAKFKEIKRRIGSDFYLTYTENDLVEGAIKGMVDGLNDPYTKYYSATEMKDRNDHLQGEYIGTGIEVSAQNEEYILIGSIKDNSPADYAGLKAGDMIVAIDTRVIASFKSEEIWALFAENGRKLVLSIVRGEESLDTELTVSNIVEQSVFSEMLDSRIGYVRISMFDAKVSRDFTTEVDALLVKGMQAMIIDLRNNSGGLASEMTRVADSILPDGKTIYYEMDKNQVKSQIKYSDAKALNIPIVILVNGSTASAAEIFASALRDNQMATLIGTKTFGKAVSQVTIPFEDGTGLVLTISQFFTSSDYNIQGVGLVPDVVVEPLEIYKNTKVQYIPRESDVQLTEALQLFSATAE